MTIDINQFWHLLIESKLVELSRIQILSKDFDAVCSAASSKTAVTGKTVAKWLLSKKVITPLQAQILLAGQCGPMRFGGYSITEKITEGPLKGSFKGKHLAANFAVTLQFLPGSKQTDLDRWKSIEALADQVSLIDHPNVVPIFESVVLPNYRFVVSHTSSGRSLSAFVPRKGRMPWKDACVIMSQVANGLEQLHARGLVHNAVSPRTIWIGGSARTSLRVPLVSDSEFERFADGTFESRHDYMAPEATSDSPEVTAKSDFYSLGCTFYRIITGKTVFPTEDIEKKIKQHRSDCPPEIEKYDIPSELRLLINKLLAKDPVDRPESSANIGLTISNLAGKPDLLQKTQVENAEQIHTFRNFLNSSDVDSIALASNAHTTAVESITDLVTGKGETTGTIGTPIIAGDAPKSITLKRKKSKWQMPLAIGTALLLMTGVIGLVAYKANQIAIVTPPDPVAPSPGVAKVIEVAPNKAQPPINARLVQNLIDDDESTLWETPTTGPPLDLSFHPRAPRMVFAFRPAQLLAHTEGKLLLRSLGPELNRRIDDWQQQFGLRLGEMDQLLFTLHDGKQNQYDSFISVRLNAPATVDDLIAKLGHPSPEQLDDTTIYTRPDNTAFYFVEDPTRSVESSVKQQPTVLRFVFGRTPRVRAVLDEGGFSVLSGPMNKLVERSDSDRHFSFLFLRPALFNEQGQSMMSGQMSNFNRQLDLFLQDEIRGGLVSFFVDEANYFEIVFDQTVDLNSEDLKTSLEERLRVLRDQIPRFLTTMPPNKYWDNVRLRYDNMLADVYRNLRWDVEFGTVIGNCWLPPMAMHNLIAASELVTAFLSGASESASTAVAKPIPSSLEELLNSRRSLDVTTNPDLNVLLTGIREEILEEYGTLPFDFQIRLMGNDLQKEGITQNQRPGDFKITDKSLAEILTEIMVRCNPDKAISGAADPNCKLVWVIGPDPATSAQQSILITTRAGASEKKLKLPPSFQPK